MDSSLTHSWPQWNINKWLLTTHASFVICLHSENLLGSDAILSSRKLNPHEAQLLNQFEKANSEADPGFFLGGGTLVSCSTSTPINHIVFFLQNTSCIRKPQVISGGGGAHPLRPPPRFTPVIKFESAQPFLLPGSAGNNSPIYLIFTTVSALCVVRKFFNMLFLQYSMVIPQFFFISLFGYV